MNQLDILNPGYVYIAIILVQAKMDQMVLNDTVVEVVE